MNQKDVERKGFLKLLATGAGATAILAMLPKGGKARASSAVSDGDAPNWAMVIDQAKCIGCGHCVKACQASNDINPDIKWTKLFEVEDIADTKVYLPVPCMHCEHAPCVSVCPVGASYYRADGIVMMDYDLCIGCRYCQAACPYQARSFNWEKFEEENPVVPEWGEPDVERRPRGVVEKCTFCYQRIDRGLSLGLTPGVDRAVTPVCVNACPEGARFFGDLNDPDSNVSKLIRENPNYRLREELGTGPRVYYLPAARGSEEV